MSEAEINLAIAQACGRCVHTDIEHWSIEDGNDYDSGFTCKACGKDPHSRTEAVPNYHGSLDACHEMEKVLRAKNKNHLFSYIVELNKLVEDEPCLVCATAPQRCEAFCRVLGIWKEQTQP